MLTLGMPTLMEAPTPEESTALCRELGLQFVELNMNLPQYQTDRFPMKTLQALRGSHNIFFTLHLDENLNPCETNPRVADAWLKTAEEALLLALELQCPIVNMHLSRGVYFTMPGEKVYLYRQYPDEYLKAMDRFRQMVQTLLAGQKTILTIENTDGFLPFQQDAIQLLLESPVFGLCYDVGHDYGAGFADQSLIHQNLHRLCHMHLHDASAQGIHLPLGEGELPLASLIALSQNGRMVLETKTLRGLRTSAEWMHQNRFR